MLHARASIEESLIYLESIPKTGLIATVREKSGKTENFSRSGKSQGKSLLLSKSVKSQGILFSGLYM